MRRARRARCGARRSPACGGGDGADEPLVVFAASSLTGVAGEIDPAAECIFGGSNDLAAQIRDGAAAGVFLSASAKPLEELRAEGLVEEPVVFASNQLVIIVPAKNPADVDAHRRPGRAGIKLVLGAEGVPIGDYAREVLASWPASATALENVVSLEEDVKGVVGKVALGEADAGIVYATDVEAAGDDVRAFPISEHFQPKISYYAAIVSPPAPTRRGSYRRRAPRPGRPGGLAAPGFLPAP